MGSEEHQKITKIFLDALKLPPDERPAFLKKACGGDEKLRREVEEMIAAYEEHPDFLEQPAVADPDLADFIVHRLKVGQIIGHYKILSAIGAGGMGEVYLAEDTKLDRKVAIKFLNEDKQSRFIQEAKAASALNDPNILTVYEIGETDGKNYLVTEFIEGKTLREHLSVREPMPFDQSLKIGVQVAEALAAAHQAGIIHRDIKPENIMIRHDGTVKVLDFGIAKITEKDSAQLDPEDKTPAQDNTQAGTIMGTAAYMSPEQVHRKKTDARTDIWSLGVVLYEMLQGVNPFKDKTQLDTIAAILKSDPAPLNKLSSQSNRIVKKALEKKTEDRYQTINDFLTDLKNLKNNDGADTFKEWLSGPGKSVRNKLLFGAGLTVLLSVVGFINFQNFTFSAVSAVQFGVLGYALLYFNRCKPKGLRSVEAKKKLNEDDRKATGYDMSKDWNDASNRAEIVLGRYIWYWQGILIAWLAFYGFLIFRGLPYFDLKNLEKDSYQTLFIIFLSICSACLNNCSAWMIFLCFNLLNKPTEIKQDGQTINDRAFSNGFSLVLGFTALEIICVLISRVIGDTDIVLRVGSGLSGIAVGITMALYVGRLQNKFLGPSTWLVVALYSYTAIQPLFLFLEGDPGYAAELPERDPLWAAGLAVALIDIALFLKCLLFLYMAWLFQSGRLLYYLVRIRPIYQKIPEDWQNFRKVLKES